MGLGNLQIEIISMICSQVTLKSENLLEHIAERVFQNMVISIFKITKKTIYLKISFLYFRNKYKY